jgi:hypothetical protein
VHQERSSWWPGWCTRTTCSASFACRSNSALTRAYMDWRSGWLHLAAAQSNASALRKSHCSTAREQEGWSCSSEATPRAYALASAPTLRVPCRRMRDGVAGGRGCCCGALESHLHVRPARAQVQLFAHRNNTRVPPAAASVTRHVRVAILPLQTGKKTEPGALSSRRSACRVHELAVRQRVHVAHRSGGIGSAVACGGKAWFMRGADGVIVSRALSAAQRRTRHASTA